MPNEQYTWDKLVSLGFTPSGEKGPSRRTISGDLAETSKTLVLRDIQVFFYDELPGFHVKRSFEDRFYNGFNEEGVGSFLDSLKGSHWHSILIDKEGIGLTVKTNPVIEGSKIFEHIHKIFHYEVLLSEDYSSFVHNIGGLLSCDILKPHSHTYLNGNKPVEKVKSLNRFQILKGEA